MPDPREVEVKGLIDTLIKKIKAIFARILSPDYIERATRAAYNKGLSDVEERLTPNLNLTPNDDAIKFLAKYTFDNIKGMNDELAERMRKELIAGMMNGESSNLLSKRVSSIMDIGRARANAIARTESHRAYNYGAAYGAKQSGLKLKKYAYNPAPKTDICKAITNRDPIPMEQQFSYGGEHWDAPPFHINCRSRVLFVQEDE
jgi:uncharacterized protein with gpF-like domain